MDVINDLCFAGSKEGRVSAKPFYHVCEVPNLATAYLGNFLRRRGFSVAGVGFYNAERPLLAELLQHRPVLLAITTTFYEHTAPIDEIVAFTREHSPTTKIVVGGPLVQHIAEMDPGVRETVLSALDIDFLIDESQGESSLAALLHHLRTGTSVSGVPNLLYREGGVWRFTWVEKENNAMSDAIINWSDPDVGFLGRSIQTRTARSCAYSCAFCDYPTRAGQLALVSPQDVFNEVRQLADLGVQNVIFIDDTFNVPERRFREVCKLLADAKLPVRWFSYFRCSSVADETVFDLMQRSGCGGVFLGIESGDDAILRNMDKVASAEKYRHGIHALKQRDILTFASFIAGFPGETSQSIDKTIEFINEAAPDLFRMEPWWYNPRAPIGNSAPKYGIEGTGYSWKHATMCIDEACDAVDRAFSSVTSAWWCPQQSFSFWAVPYLQGKGMTMSEIKEFHWRCHSVLQRQCIGEAANGEVDSLRAFILDLRLDAPRFFQSA